MNGRDGTIDELRALVAKQAAQIKQLTARIAELELELAKARKDSSTSSKPPSSDITKPKPKKKPGGGIAPHGVQLEGALRKEDVGRALLCGLLGCPGVDSDCPIKPECPERLTRLGKAIRVGRI